MNHRKTMKHRKRSIIQLAITLMVILNCIIYYLYIKDQIDIRVLSIGDLNPYGGWSALKSLFTDVSYRWRGVTRAIAMTISIMVTSLLMGRIFCGFICPIGFIQDFFKFMGNKIGIKDKMLIKGKVFNPQWIKYFVLILLLMLTTIRLGNYISPLSPWLAFLNIFMGIKIKIGFIVLIMIVILSLWYKRIFCRIFCPLGAFQSLMYAIGPLKINRNEICNGCSICLDDCLVDIEYSHELEISPECINCLKCTETNCIKNSRGYSIKFAGKKIKNNLYIAMSLGIFLSIYVFVPLLFPYGGQNTMLNIGDIESGVYQSVGVGFGGTMLIEVTVEENKLSKIEVIKHRETSGYYEEVFKNMGREIIQSQNLNIDAISGATVTSRGFLSGVKNGVSQAMNKN